MNPPDLHSFSEYERTTLLRAFGVLDSILLTLQRIATKYGCGDDPIVIARAIEKFRKLESASFEDTKQLYFTVCMAIARAEEWRFTGETLSALLVVRDTLKESMRAAAESEGKSAEYEAAERMFQQHMDDFHNPDAALRGFDAARAIEAMERHGIDASEIKRLAKKSPEDLEKDLRDAERLKLLGVEEFSRQQGAATRKRALRWVGKAFCCVVLILAALWVLARFLGA